VQDDVVQIVDNLASEDDVTPRSKEDEKAREPKGQCLAILLHPVGCVGPAFSGNKVDALPEEQPDSLQRIEALVSDFMVGSVGFCRDDSILIFQ